MNDSRVGRLEAKTALITGAGAGIGRASALLFAREGGAVACADRSIDAARSVADEIVALGGRAVAIEADVSRREDITRMVDEAIAVLGPIDVLFNNAGTGVRGKVHELPEETWDMILATNLTSVFLTSKAVIPRFLAQGHGVIVNNASSLGVLASPAYPAYCASKAGVIMLTKQMALDYGPAIRVNCICPGATNSPRMQRNIASAPDPVAALKRVSDLNVAFGRLAEPEEIARAALFLASDDSAFCTGTALVIDGGQTTDA
jgi:NAD(P)-dependent dehydrogenase (short-subunit alcohol dehydrogenase family)